MKIRKAVVVPLATKQKRYLLSSLQTKIKVPDQDWASVTMKSHKFLSRPQNQNSQIKCKQKTSLLKPVHLLKDL